jgi:hypothetical protein
MRRIVDILLKYALLAGALASLLRSARKGTRLAGHH